MSSFLDVSLPVLAAPMAGGPSTPALVRAAASVGSLGFLAGGYKTAEALAAEIDEVRSINFGVNLFAPNPLLVDPAEFRRYALTIQEEGTRYGLDLAAAVPIEDDDYWAEKIDLLLRDPVPVVSFTFGIPSNEVIAALRKRGTIVVQTVTSAAEAVTASDSGVDALAVQSSWAGGHSGTLTPLVPVAPMSLPDLLAAVRARVALPLVGAGGLATPIDVAATLTAGADAVMVGTVLLLADEAGTSATHRAALADPRGTETVITHAFTGRPARALRNEFTDRYSGTAPYGYPALHHLTSPLRKAASAAGDPDRLHLWAGTGYRYATASPTAGTLQRLMP